MLNRLSWCVFPAALAVIPPTQAAELSGSVALTSDYVFRGTSQSNEVAAGQVGLRVDAVPGGYGSIWASYAGASELTYVEGITTATWRDHFWMTLGLSDDVFATSRTGVYTQAGLRTPLADNLKLELAGGYYWLDRAYARSYAHGQATMAWLMKPGIELRLSGHLTDHNARVLFGDLAGTRLEASLQASF